MAVRKASSALCFAILGASATPTRANESAASSQSREAPLNIIAGTAKSVQKGIASWYGRAFHGRPTASGERFDMHALSAAHPTLPLSSYVRVRNSENNREVVVRINDRGPFHGGRIIDLSYAAAQQLDVRGLGKVVLELITGSELQAIRNGRRVQTASNDAAEPPRKSGRRAGCAGCGRSVLRGARDGDKRCRFGGRSQGQAPGCNRSGHRLIAHLQAHSGDRSASARQSSGTLRVFAMSHPLASIAGTDCEGPPC